MKTVLIVLQILGAITFIPWFSMAGLSFIAFLSPKSIKNRLSWLFVFTIFCYPLVAGVSYWWSWANLADGYGKSAIFCSCLPLVVFGIVYFIMHNSRGVLDRIKR